ncbi:MAG: hypothetical protein BWX99_02300 [Deltaproteobacteria bacterium ADurb.Bin151]|nr:MAG: hypothetical protein BWX99_02300 [Deltaproteobacteria bacterium ADurb.Bin151]
MFHVGQPEKMCRTLAGLYIFKSNIINFFPAVKRMINVLEHLEAGGFDVHFVGFHTQGFHQVYGIAVGFAGCPERGHRVGFDVRAGPAQQVHGTGGDKQSVRGIQSPRNSDHQVRDSRRFEPLGQSLDLNIVGFVTSLVTLPRVGWNVRETGDLALRH